MAVALTQFVQPMLMGEQSSNSSIQIINEDGDDLNLIDIRDDDPISVRPSPSPSPSKSLSHSQSPFISSPSSNQMSDDTNNDINNNNNNNNVKNENGKTNIIIMDENDEETESLKEEESISISQCRYCYQSISKEKSVSQCLCSSVLCKECLINELKLCHGRNNGLLQCTVCKSQYDVKTEFAFKYSKDCHKFCNGLIHCGLKDEQYLLDSVGGKVGFFLVILGINTWILSTSLLFAFPPNGCPIELYYMVSIFDFAVGISTIWFIIKCRWLSPLFLSIMYGIRTIYVLLGWIPSINLCNIYIYHHKNSNHISILIYFLVFSFFASIIMAMCWIIDLKSQFNKYSKENGKLVLSKNNIKIEINDIGISHHHHQDENDNFE